ncbi:Protein CBG25531 [Caenorhabditis briggsae]|uniref:Protein CBG25531 n=1 Tax=Caenorhabditis briggsae TaxID=6238 RepID=B6II54_CAEBR|nr:Protein CBG25531 [Caenorhabditis briggsae]CAR99584.1 Protein CBG25531 [Caenorhabditis briggsae]
MKTGSPQVDGVLR